MRKWRENEEMERECGKGDSLSIFPHFLFLSSLYIHFLNKNCLILSQNVKCGTFVTNIKNLSKVIIRAIRQ